MLCAEQSVEVTDYDTVLFFDGSIFELHPYAFREIRQADTEEIIYMAGQHMPVLFVVLVFSLLPSEC
ncbi:hypothetical protein NSQ38_06895 [Paenibacillus sp. FSL R7-0313]|uniref:hypothetical protein n=1 Tax=Paenibacillus sp. FSL R7-0313 TaxID=2954532 RepID=UPI0030DDD6B3